MPVQDLSRPQWTASAVPAVFFRGWKMLSMHDTIGLAAFRVMLLQRACLLEAVLSDFL
jgi:hypothetical protein